MLHSAARGHRPASSSNSRHIYGHLRTAKAALIRALEITENLLDGFPIPGAKGTIGAVLQIVGEAEVYTKRAKPTPYYLYELCNELKEHILRLHDQLLRPLSGSTEEIPNQTRTAIEDYTESVTCVHLRMGV